ncbi:hypothetical protein EZV62_021279 [Acer yangbiense]|uniref:Cytochrome P450 n=1 Tax=Acer yangbiense TaxID=1000413 RepID=A0A5C7H5A6_9ROSI|nr:hypothetical protein EZV62_021279 [Acer yangbiense]
MALLMIILLSLAIFILFLFQIYNTKTSVRFPPGPKGFPLIGNLHQLDNSKPHQYLWKLSKEYGPLMSLHIGFVPTLVVSSAKMAKEVLKTHDLHFCSRPSLLGQQKLSYNGFDLAFAPYNDYYREMRKLCVVHLFNPTRVQQFRPIREDEVSRMIEKISKSVFASKPVNLSALVMSLTSTIICRVAFGKRYEDEGVERSRFQALLNETQAMFASFFFSDHFPFMGWIDRFTGLISRLEKNFKNFDTFYQELIDEHLDSNRPKSEQEDIIDVLLQLRTKRLFKIDLTMDHIKGVLMLALANLLYKFDWQMPDGMKTEELDFDVLPGLTMHKKNPLLLMADNYVAIRDLNRFQHRNLPTPTRAAASASFKLHHTVHYISSTAVTTAVFPFLVFDPGGNVLFDVGALDNSKLHQYLWKLSKEYGPLMSLRLGNMPTLVVSSAKMAKEVMKTHDLHFCSRPSLLGQQKLSYNGLDLAFAPYNDYWREMRKICVVHLFNSNRVQQFRPIREDEVSRMIEKISKSVVACKPVNLSELTISLTSTIICRVAFGKRYEDEGIERSRFQALLNETQAMFTSFFFSDHFPFMGWIDRFTGLISRLEKNFKNFDTFYQELIDEHLDANRRKTEEEDILDVLLQLRKERLFKIDLTMDHIKGVLMNIFVAGTDTSSATVIWIMTYLMKNPKAMKKAQEEVRNLIGNKGFVDEDNVQKLSYLKAVVKETMRLQPTAPLLVQRETTKKCILEGYEIPTKTVVYVNAWAIGRDPEAWENSEEFDPDRFIGNSIDLKGQNFELIPFGAGRRICPGIYMGISIVELALANLLYKFDWQMQDGMKKEDLDFDALPGLAMHKKNPLQLIAKIYI